MTRAPTDRAAAERRAEYRALATDPGYQPRSTWKCATCDESNRASATRCSTCGSQGPAWQPAPRQTRPPVPIIVRVASGRRRERGQAIVETALVLPLILFIGLGFAEVGFLIATKADQDRAAAVVATWAAGHRGESWSAVATRELPGCDVTVTETLPDLFTAAATCEYRPHVTPGWDGLPISSEESAATPGGSNPPSEPTPELSPTP